MVSTPTERYPEGVTRVVLFGDPTKALGTLAEPECARVIGALDDVRGAVRAEKLGEVAGEFDAVHSIGHPEGQWRP